MGTGGRRVVLNELFIRADPTVFIFPGKTRTRKSSLLLLAALNPTGRRHLVLHGSFWISEIGNKWIHRIGSNNCIECVNILDRHRVAVRFTPYRKFPFSGISADTGMVGVSNDYKTIHFFFFFLMTCEKYCVYKTARACVIFGALKTKSTCILYIYG